MAETRKDKTPIVLTPHSTEWAAMARAEADKLAAALGDQLLVVHHIGSTAIPGIKAKPIVDLLPVVLDIRALDSQKSAITALGYEWLGEYGLPGRRFCRLIEPQTSTRKFHAHFYAVGNSEITRHIAFRDYLLAYPAIAKTYEAEKEAAAALNPNDRLAYNDAKNDWVKRTERDALRWWPSSRAN